MIKILFRGGEPLLCLLHEAQGGVRLPRFYEFCCGQEAVAPSVWAFSWRGWENRKELESQGKMR